MRNLVGAAVAFHRRGHQRTLECHRTSFTPSPSPASGPCRTSFAAGFDIEQLDAKRFAFITRYCLTAVTKYCVHTRLPLSYCGRLTAACERHAGGQKRNCKGFSG